MVKNPHAMQKIWVRSLGREDPLGTSQVATVVKNLPANAGETRHTGSIPGLGRSSGVGNGKLFQYSCMENSVDRGDWPWSLREFILPSSSMNLTNSRYFV